MNVPNVPFEDRMISYLISSITKGWEDKTIFLDGKDHNIQTTEPLKMRNGWSSIFDIAFSKIPRENICYKIEQAQIMIAPCDIEKIIKRLVCARKKLGVKTEEKEKVLV